MNVDFQYGCRRWRGKNSAQYQVGGKKEDKPQRAQPQDDIKVLIDPVLWQAVVETVKVINIDGEIGEQGKAQ